jgi:polyphosphate kinase
MGPLALVRAPVESRPLRQRLWDLLQINLNDYRQSWEIQPDGSHVARRLGPDTAANPAAQLGTHRVLMMLAAKHVLEDGVTSGA